MSKKPDEKKNHETENCPDLFREALRHRVDLFTPVIEDFLSDPLASREEVDLFVRHGGADVNGKTKDGTPFLLAALDNNHPRAFRLLIEQPGVQLDPKDNRGRTPFLAAVIQGNLPAVQAMAARKLEMDLNGKEGQAALDWAANRCDGRMLNYLLDWWGDNLAAGFREGWWDRIRKQDTTRRLYERLSHEVRPNFIRNEIVHYGRPEMIQTMHGAGYSLDEGDPKTGMTPLHIAAETGPKKSSTDSKKDPMDLARTLITAGVKLDQANQKGQTPLMLAALHGHPDILKMLIDLGADVHRQDQDGETALIHIFRNPKGISFDACQALIEKLMDAHADVNHQNKRGVSALHLAADLCRGDVRPVHLLLKAGANVHAKDNNHFSPLDYARGVVDPTQNRAVIELLEERSKSGWEAHHDPER